MLQDISNPQLLLGTAILLGFFVLFAFVSLRVHFKLESRRRELAHIERLKALESGRGLPDGDVARARTIGWVAGGVPVLSFLLALGATALDYLAGGPGIHVAVISVVWAVTGFVGAIAIVIGLAVFPRSVKPCPEPESGPAS